MPENSLSANTLFHFTKKLDSIISILTNEFYVSYSLEDWEPFVGEEFHVYIPMVSFCDIPLSQIHNHANTYGDYAIGLSKEWGIKQGINPVVYMTNSATLSKPFERVFTEIEKAIIAVGHAMDKNDNRKERAAIVTLNRRMKNALLLQYVKPYIGKHPNKNKIVKYYDEREWRFIPTDIVEFIMGSLMEMKDKYQEKAKNIKISFEPEDIKYIIVKNEKQILRIAQKIENIKGKYPHDQVELLKTKIMSMEQIRSDF